MPELDAHLDGMHVGQFQRSSGGAITFHYGEQATMRTPLSLSMPRTLTAHKQRAARPYLEGLLPDNPGALEAIANEYQTSPRSIFGLLAGVGRDVPGALQLIAPMPIPMTRRTAPRPARRSMTRTSPSASEPWRESCRARLRHS